MSFKDFADFVFRILWRQKGLTFHDSEKDLEKDIHLLSKLGLFDYDVDRKVIEIDEEDLQILTKIVNGMKQDPTRKMIPLINEYIETIEQTTSV